VKLFEYALISGVLFGLFYGFVGIGLNLLFGVMRLVNFAHGEFLMVAMYLMFGLVTVTGLDPLLLWPVVTACLFLLGSGVYLGIIRYTMRAKTNRGMVQVFTTFGLGLILTGLAQSLLSPDYRSIGHTWISGRQPVNPSGGLLSRGHPLGATGLAQLAEIVWQLRGDAGARQVDGARIGLVETMGGGTAGVDGNGCVVAVLGG
jgi:branched-chain amino acid transport system permease protein